MDIYRAAKGISCNIVIYMYMYVQFSTNGTVYYQPKFSSQLSQFQHYLIELFFLIACECYSTIPCCSKKRSDDSFLPFIQG